MLKKRRNFTPEQKIEILKKHLLEEVSVPDICDQYEIHLTVFYRWLKALFENGGL